MSLFSKTFRKKLKKDWNSGFYRQIGGLKHQNKNILWNKNTIVNVHSTGKGIVLMCVSILIDKGILNINEYVHNYWPEFKKKNKQKI